MLENIVGNADAPFTCSNCGKIFTQRIKRLNVNPTLVCPKCKHQTTVDMDAFNKLIKEANEMMKNLPSQF